MWQAPLPAPWGVTRRMGNPKILPMNHTNPLATGNRMQRAYYRWALPHYERMGRSSPELRAEVEEIDQFLYTRAGLPAWLGWLMGLGGMVIGLRSAGADWWPSVVLALLLWIGLTVCLISAWLGPSRDSGLATSRLLSRFAAGLLVGAGAAIAGLAVGHWMRHGAIDWAQLERMLEKASLTVVVVMSGLMLLVVAVSWAGRVARARRLQRVELMAERDAARATAAEAELRLLQAQIHPHFVFNTLATLQHWVDQTDPRAGPLLRELTGFLRRSTEMLGRPLVQLEEETQAAAHYLEIMRTRMGPRLSVEWKLDPQCAHQTVPPGLLLTLVENAIEHGLEPKIGGGRIVVSTGCGATGNWWLRVEDDGIGLDSQAKDHVGLSNLRLRLQQHYGPRARFSLDPMESGGACAEIRMAEAA